MWVQELRRLGLPSTRYSAFARGPEVDPGFLLTFPAATARQRTWVLDKEE